MCQSSRCPGFKFLTARNEQAAARLADTEIGFALGEESSRAEWILPPAQVEAVERRPMLAVNPYALSADEARRGGGKFKWIRDPLYGEIRVLVAVFDARYIVWPIEVFYDKDEETNSGRVVIRTVFLDGRSGDVLWQGNIFGQDEPLTSPGALPTPAAAPPPARTQAPSASCLAEDPVAARRAQSPSCRTHGTPGGR